MNERIATRIQQAMHAHRLPGLAVAIRQHDGEIFADGFGHIDARGQHPVTADTAFGLASLSKFVTASLVMLLNEKGRLSTNDLMSQHFPDLQVFSDRPVRVRHLLSHSAGLPGLPCRYYARNVDDPDDRSGGTGGPGRKTPAGPHGDEQAPTIVSATQLVDLINRLSFNVLAPPGELLNYSNEGFCLLGGMIEQVTGLPFACLVRDKVFTPLGMNQSFVGNDYLSSPAQLALPLMRDGDSYRVGRFWQAPLFYPAGGVIASARDVARLIGALSNQSELLRADSREQMMRSHMSVPSRADSQVGYGFGLECHQVDSDTTIVWHSGQRAGISSFMGWLVQKQLAISVLCHIADAPVASIGHALIGDLLNRSDIRWPPNEPVSDSAQTPRPALTGRYGSDESGISRVEQVGPDLYLQGSSSQATPVKLQFLTPDSGLVGEHTFRFLDNPQALAFDLRVWPRID